MRRPSSCPRAALIAVVLATSPASAQVWEDATPACLGVTEEWTSKVELADLDGDGRLDIVLVNGGDYASAGAPERSRVFRNLGVWDGSGPACAEISDAVLGPTPGLHRVAKAADLDRDGDLDLFLGGAWHTRSRLLRRDPDGWTDISATALPAVDVSVGDAEIGDVDGDGHLDLVLADGGPRDPFDAGYVGAAVLVWTGDGQGHFVARPELVPADPIAWSWDLELADIDGDWKLDLLVSCKLCTASVIARNGASGFGAYERLPGGGNNYELAPIDVDGDGDLDLATINDGPGGRDRLLLGDGAGHFTDVTATHLTGAANPPEDDNVVAWLDVDDDGDPDLLVGSLSGPDRLLANDGTGRMTLVPGATPDDTPGTLGLATGDLDGDHRVDLVQGQGEVATPDRVQRASAAVAIDTQPPRIILGRAPDAPTVLVARIDDRRGRASEAELAAVTLEVGAAAPVPMRWIGGTLWRGEAGTGRHRVCAEDRAGNRACVDEPALVDGPPAPPPPVDAPLPGDPSEEGGCCQGSPASSSIGGALLAVLGYRRRRARRPG